jgi:DNA-binding NarL/FixJ family response regulator
VDLPPIVGRERELATILRLAEEARRRPGPVAVLITGDPGQGKTRLVTETADRVERVEWLRAQGFEPERNVPLAAAGELLRRLAPLEPLSMPSDPEPPGPSMEPIRIFERAARAMGILGPTLVTLDDVQWADELSLALCHYLLRAAASASQPLVLVVAGRDTPAIVGFEEAVRHVLEPDSVASIALRPLDREAGLTLLREAAPDLPAADATEIWRRAAGSPFWLHALASGTDRRAPDVVATRLRGLAEDAAGMLGAIAVVGRPVGARELADLLGWPAERAADAAVGLTDRGLVVDRGAGLQVVHDLLRDAAIERLRPETRHALHRTLSERLERTAGDDVGLLREAFEHRRMGGLPARELAERLLHSPRRRWLGRDALRELAAIVDEETSRTPEWGGLSVEIATLAVEMNDQPFALERWRDVADRTEEAPVLAAAALGAAKAAFELERGSVARAWIERARAASAGSTDPALKAALDATDALVLIWLEHRLADGEIVAERAAQAVRVLIHEAGGAQRLAPDAWRATLAALRVRWDAFIQRDDRVPVSLTEELLAVTAHDESAHLAAVVLAGLAAEVESQLQVAEERFRMAWDEARRRIIPAVAVDAGFWLALTLFDTGRLTESEALIEEVQALADRAGDHGKIRARSRTLPDELRLLRGDWAAAAESLRRGAESAPDAHRRIAFHQALAKWTARVRPNAVASDHLEAGMADAVAGGCPRCTASFHLAAAQVAGRIGERDLGRQLLDSWTAERPSPDGWSITEHRWARALLELDAGRALETVEELEQLVLDAEAIDRHLKANVIRLDRARILATLDRGRAAESFREAARLAAAQGAVVLERLAERELRALGVRTWRRGAAVGAIDELTARELEVAVLVARGATNPEIAARLFLSRKTVERHVSNVLGKMGVRNRAELSAVLAAREGTKDGLVSTRNEGAPR